MASVLVSTSSFAVYDTRPLDLLAAAGHEVHLNPHGRRLTPEESRTLLASSTGLIAGTEELSRKVLEFAPGLKVISRCGAGMDAVDLDAAAELGISVFRTSESHVDAVAELALAGILDVLRHISAADRDLRAGKWQKPMGRLLHGKTVRIVGFGRTGRRLAQLLQPFSVEILAVDPKEDRGFASEHGVTYGSLRTVAQRSDILTLHLDYSPAVHHLVDRSIMELMPAGAILVNGARGGLLDEQALAEALRDKRLAGAYLDVFEEEPYSGVLTEFDNVLLTPHIGSYAVEGRIAMEIEATENLIHGLAQASA
ncbi:MAG: phosphoglycerate dehydrogenase [Acidobacteria bacterium]|nr:phosphoglycerate dehydrogenase [Acidobacteriota bacterium]